MTDVRRATDAARIDYGDPGVLPASEDGPAIHEAEGFLMGETIASSRTRRGRPAKDGARRRTLRLRRERPAT